MFKTLKSLSNHPAFGGMERSNARDFIRSNGFKIVVYLKRGFWNARHAVNVVMGNTANEVLAFFNDGSIKAESELNAAERNAIGIAATPNMIGPQLPKPEFSPGDRASWDGYLGTIHSVTRAPLPHSYNAARWGWRYQIICDNFGSVQTFTVSSPEYATK